MTGRNPILSLFFIIIIITGLAITMNRINRKGRKKAMETVSPDGRFSSLTNLGLTYDDFARGEHGKDDDNDE